MKLPIDRVFVLFCLLVPATMAADQGEWNALEIPGAWKKPPANVASDGFCWFRCFVNVPSNWRGRELKLYAESVDDARQFYFNGVKIGEFGTFPPEFRSGLGQESRFVVPSGTVLYDQPNVVAIRVHIKDARTNFNVAAPVLFGGDVAIRTVGRWQHRAGDNMAWSRPTEAAAKEFTFSELAKSAEIEKQLKAISDGDRPLSLDESLSKFETPDDLTVQLAIGEPHVRQPLSIKWDERGRLWVVQYLQYPSPAGLTMVSRDKYLRSVYDKVPPAPPNHFPGKDKITIHEDTDGDGRYDKHKTFVDGLSMVSSFALGRGGVWVLNPPYLLFYPDRDNDDQPDGDPIVHLEGFGLEDSHSIANSLRWGPDGWLYAAQGSTVTGNIRRPGTDALPVHSMGQLIWRYHPEKRRYEIFAEGGGNTFGVEIDSQGRIYSGHNGGDTRGFHYVQGGYYRKGFGKHGELSNPYTFGYFPHMPHHRVARFTHNFVIYEDPLLPPDYLGRLFGVGPLQSHVVTSQMDRNGSSFKSHDVGHAFTTSDSWCRPVDIQVGPDGAIYVVDFYEQRIDHASHYQGRIHRESGRIYRICPKGFTAPKIGDLSKLSTAELAATLASPNRQRRQTALRLIGDRRDATLIPKLVSVLRAEVGQIALESLWALNLSGGFDESTARALLDHADPMVRTWTVRLLCDDQRVSPAIARQLAARAESDLHVEVRSQLACSARRLPAEQCLPIVRNLLYRSVDTSDVHIPLLLWWAIEAKIADDRDGVVDLFRGRELWEQPMVSEHIIQRLMRRFALSGSRQDLLACAQLLSIAPNKELATLLMAGFEEAYQGRSLAALPEELVNAMAKAGGGSLGLRLRQGLPDAIDESLKIVADEKAAPAHRVQLLTILGEVDEPKCVPVLIRIATTGSSSNDIRATAMTALSSYQDPRVAKALIEAHPQIPTELHAAMHSVLASRRQWSEALLAAVDAGAVDASVISLDTVRKMLLHGGDKIKSLTTKHWGQVDGATTDQMKRDIKRITELIHSGSGNPYDGKKLYDTSCGKCHQLFNEGGRIGPDLTSFKRDDLQRVLVNVINPSIEVREGFETTVVVTLDGRVLVGFVEDQDNRVVVLKGANGEVTVLSRDDIDEMRAVRRSLMPEGLLRYYDNQQIRDLFAYLRSTQPLP